MRERASVGAHDGGVTCVGARKGTEGARESRTGGTGEGTCQGNHEKAGLEGQRRLVTHWEELRVLQCLELGEGV